MRRYLDPLLGYLFIIVSSSIVLIGVWTLMEKAFGAEVCLTKSQAKAKWPKAWLYWHTDRHCWDNIPGHHKQYRDPIKTFAQDANGGKSALLKFVSGEEFNELDAQADADAFFRAKPLPLWPVVMPHPRFIPWEERIDDVQKDR
jgi:hypothetical protein